MCGKVAIGLSMPLPSKRLPNAVKIRGAVSPATRASASKAPVRIPRPAVGTITSKVTFQRGTPRASAASRIVPGTIREAALALGVPRWKVTLLVILPTAGRGILTGALLALARVAGETAPLIFTAFGNRFSGNGLLNPIATLPHTIYTYAISPYEDWHNQAWAAALVLMLLVLGANLAARLWLKPS